MEVRRQSWAVQTPVVEGRERSVAQLALEVVPRKLELALRLRGRAQQVALQMKVEDLFSADLNMLELSMDIVECETSGRTGMVLGLEERIKRQMNLKFQAQEYLQRLLKASTIFKSSPTQARYYMKLYKEELSGFGTKDSQHERFEKESRKRIR